MPLFLEVSADHLLEVTFLHVFRAGHPISCSVISKLIGHEQWPPKGCGGIVTLGLDPSPSSASPAQEKLPRVAAHRVDPLSHWPIGAVLSQEHQMQFEFLLHPSLSVGHHFRAWQSPACYLEMKDSSNMNQRVVPMVWAIHAQFLLLVPVPVSSLMLSYPRDWFDIYLPGI